MKPIFGGVEGPFRRAMDALVRIVSAGSKGLLGAISGGSKGLLSQFRGGRRGPTKITYEVGMTGLRPVGAPLRSAPRFFNSEGEHEGERVVEVLKFRKAAAPEYVSFMR